LWAKERVIVFDEAGRRDDLYSFERNGDVRWWTPPVCRKSKWTWRLKSSIIKSLQAIEKSNVVIIN
jgi:hypothetical protein